MSKEVNVIFDSVDHSDALEKRIRTRVQKLQNHHAQILACNVRVSAVDRQHSKGMTYAVNIDIKVPRKQIVVSHEPGDRGHHDDPYVAVRDAFNVAQRQLEEHGRKLRQTKR
jgi:ribosome-associated translation inhibitor RaiA